MYRKKGGNYQNLLNEINKLININNGSKLNTELIEKVKTLFQTYPEIYDTNLGDNESIFDLFQLLILQKDIDFQFSENFNVYKQDDDSYAFISMFQGFVNEFIKSINDEYENENKYNILKTTYKLLKKFINKLVTRHTELFKFSNFLFAIPQNFKEDDVISEFIELVRNLPENSSVTDNYIKIQNLDKYLNTYKHFTNNLIDEILFAFEKYKNNILEQLSYLQQGGSINKDYLIYKRKDGRQVKKKIYMINGKPKVRDGKKNDKILYIALSTYKKKYS